MNAPQVFPALTPEALAERWRELLRCEGLPDRFEIDEYGELIAMYPPRTAHQRIVAALQRQIQDQLGGEALPGAGVLTRIGVRIPDVVWQLEWLDDDPVQPAPTLCVEVQSASNTRRELNDKVAAYLEAGAKEVILVDLAGRIRFFQADGERSDSAFGLRLSLPPGTAAR